MRKNGTVEWMSTDNSKGLWVSRIDRAYDLVTIEEDGEDKLGDRCSMETDKKLQSMNLGRPRKNVTMTKFFDFACKSNRSNSVRRKAKQTKRRKMPKTAGVASVTPENLGGEGLSSGDLGS